MNQLCKCGCGQSVIQKSKYYTAKYICGHSSRKYNLQEILNKILKSKDICHKASLNVGTAHIHVKELWELYYKKQFPEKMFACHECDNELCVNLFHIFPGSNKENMQDASKKGRLTNRQRGESHYFSKLMDAEVVRIYKLYESGQHTQKELAIMFNVSRRTIFDIVHKNLWRHVHLNNN